MVFSKINKTIQFAETKKIEPDDTNMESDIYEIDLLNENIPVIFAIGKIKKNYQNQNVIYFPMYLVKKNKKVVQIGIFELPQSDNIHYLDADNNIDTEKLHYPLLFHFVSSDYLRKNGITESEFLHSDDSDIESTIGSEKYVDAKTNMPNLPDTYTSIPDSRKDLFELTQNIPLPALLPTETKSMSNKIKEKYSLHDSNTNTNIPSNWIQKYMKNPNYEIIENEGQGDCFFASVRDAFSSIGQQTTVSKLRKRLSDEVTQEIYENYKELYDMYHNKQMEDTSTLKTLLNEYKMIKTRMEETLERNERTKLYNSAIDLQNEHNKLKEEIIANKKMANEFSFMKDVQSIDSLKQKIQTPNYWADSRAISTLEHILHVKFIILSEENYKENDIKHIVLCGEKSPLFDSFDSTPKQYYPDFYILLDYSKGNHYRLISYKHKQIFQFQEIPYDIKRLIHDKCLEKNSGLFAMIPDFIDQQQQQHGGYSMNNHDIDDDILTITDARLRNLFDDSIVFVFYDKSNNALPGKGPNEKIPPEKTIEFTKLSVFPFWRRKLDDKWTNENGKSLFTLGNHTWLSVEHYYQASKFRKNNANFYLSFSLESGTEISKNVEIATSAGSREGIHKTKGKEELLRPEQVVIDPDFYGERKKQVIQDAQYAKFSQNPELAIVLLSTNKAKLMHYRFQMPPELAETLMLVREKIDHLTKT